MPPLIDLTGQTFGRLTVIERAENDPGGRAQWLCLCECGNGTVARGDYLRNGHTVSCGCYQRERVAAWSRKHKLIHGHSRKGRRHPLYGTWNNMKQRCFNPNAPDYPDYGGRGITVCERWVNSFPAFLEDVGERPPDPEGWESKKPYYSLDRIDNNGHYEPGNVRWASWEEQNNNKRGEEA